MHSADEKISRAIAILTQEETPRVWSFLVTLFGDLAQGEDDAISGALLARLGEAAGLRPETIRVALHRLRKDGWIVSHRAGRSSVYALSSFGRRQSAEATPRIYAEHGPDGGAWTLLLADPGGGASEALDDVAARIEAIALGSHALLCAGPVKHAPCDLLAIRSDSVEVPDWLKAQICPIALVEAYSLLTRRLAEVESVLPGQVPDAISAATLRALVVHSWRRVLLRHPDLPDMLFPDNWPGRTCRASVHRILARLPRFSLDKLEGATRLGPTDAL